MNTEMQQKYYDRVDITKFVQETDKNDNDSFKGYTHTHHTDSYRSHSSY